MKDHIKKLRAELKQLNGLQWARKRQLRDAVYIQAEAAKFGDDQKFYQKARTISRLTKDLNRRKYDIRIKESNLQQILMSVSKDTYFSTEREGYITGLHAVGFKGPDGEFMQEEIWFNTYKVAEDGTISMHGGSGRCFGQFDDVVKEIETEGANQLTVKDGKLV